MISSNAAQDFLWHEVPRIFLAGDASSRTYYLLRHLAETRVYMDSPDEDTAPFIAMTHYLRDLELSAPAIYESSPQHIILENLGARGFRQALQQGADAQELYAKAIHALTHLHQNAKNTLSLHPYDLSEFMRELEIFTEWYMIPRGYSAEQCQEFLALWPAIVKGIPALPSTCVLRDFMVDNLMDLTDRSGIQACGLLDYQDALWGSPAYDLVSLLDDARIDVCPLVREAMIDLYLESMPQISREDFMHHYYVWGAQRNFKILGVFSRLALRDGKDRYMEFMPRIWGLLESEMQYPALRSVREWANKNIKVR